MHDIIASAINVEDTAITNLVYAHLHDVIDVVLSDDERELLHDVYWRGRRITEVAAEQGVSRQAVSARLHRVLNRIKKNW